MKRLFGLFLLVFASGAWAHTSESQAPWNAKCDKEKKFYEQPGVCQGPHESSTVGTTRIHTFKKCFQGKSPVITLRYFKVNDPESPFHGQSGCRLDEQREGGLKTTIYYEKGTRHVVSRDNDGKLSEITVYTKDGMLTCDKWSEADKKFDWCGLTDSLRPSTNDRPYVKVDDISMETRRDILAGRRTLQDVFPLSGAPAPVVGTAAATAPAASR
jgi:hypothetical protein